MQKQLPVRSARASPAVPGPLVRPAGGCRPHHAFQLRNAGRSAQSVRLQAIGTQRRSSTSGSTTVTVAEEPTTLVSAEQSQPLSSTNAAARWWDELGVHKKIVLACAGGFMLSNMDKTNFTVAVIPMALTYGWSPTVSGLVQSAFFYGFLLCQLPGGMLATKLGGAYVLPRGLALWSAATAAIPLVAGDMTALCITRSIMGAGEAMAPSSIIDMITRTVPAKERASAVSFAFSGLHMGSIIGLLASPAIIEALGWPSLFYIFGVAGALWLVWFHGIVDEVQRRDPALAASLLPTSAGASGTESSGAVGSAVAAQQQEQQEQSIPYRAFLRSRPVQVLAFTHFCHNWFHYTMLSWLPTYFTSTLSVDLMHAAQTALLPPIAGMVASTAAGQLGDRLLAAGVPLPTVRKAAQSLGFLAPTLFLALASQVPCTPEESAVAVACITAALGLSSFSLAGLYCSHGDLSPKYASALLGLTNVAGSLPGIIGVAFVGFLYDQTHDWSLSLFLPSALFLVAGTGVYVWLGRNAAIDFDAMDNSEFAFERAIKQAASALPFPGKGAAAAVRKAAGAVRRTLSGAAAQLRASEHHEREQQEREQQQQQQQQLQRERRRSSGGGGPNNTVSGRKQQ